MRIKRVAKYPGLPVWDIDEEISKKTRAQILDLIEATVSADKVEPTKRLADNILNDLRHRLEDRFYALVPEAEEEIPLKALAQK